MVGGFFLPLRLSLPSTYGINPSGAIAASPSDETVIKGTRDSLARVIFHKGENQVLHEFLTEILYLFHFSIFFETLLILWDLPARGADMAVAAKHAR